jgi:hypothetical protein
MRKRADIVLIERGLFCEPDANAGGSSAGSGSVIGKRPIEHEAAGWVGVLPPLEAGHENERRSPSSGPGYLLYSQQC